jgi:hypothetical protein
MEVRIVVSEAEGASALAERLNVAFGAERISLRRDRPEVDVRVEGNTDRAVLRVLDAVEAWLDRTAVGWAEMWLGERSYRVAR